MLVSVGNKLHFLYCEPFDWPPQRLLFVSVSLTSCPVEVYCFEFDRSEQFELTYRESIVLGSPAYILRSRAHLKQTLNTQQCEQHAINYFQIIIIKAPMVLTQTSHCAASIASAVLIVSLAVSEGFFIVARLRTKSSL